VLQKEVSTLTERCRATGLTMVWGEAPRDPCDSDQPSSE
jgi:hypothetical protein